jgi:hypothetical protein
MHATSNRSGRRPVRKLFVVSALVAIPLWFVAWRVVVQGESPTADFRAYRCASGFMESLRRRDYEGLLKYMPKADQARFAGRADILRYDLPEVSSYSLRGIRVMPGSKTQGYVEFRFSPTWRGGDRVWVGLGDEAGRCIVVFPDYPENGHSGLRHPTGR